MSSGEHNVSDEFCELYFNNVCELGKKCLRIHAVRRVDPMTTSMTTNESDESFEIIETEDWEVVKTEDCNRTVKSLAALAESNIGERQMDDDVASSSHFSTSSQQLPIHVNHDTNENKDWSMSMVEVEETQTNVESSFYSVEGAFNDRSEEILGKMLNTFDGKDIYEAYKSGNDEVKNIRDDIREDIYEDSDEESISEEEGFSIKILSEEKLCEKEEKLSVKGEVSEDEEMSDDEETSDDDEKSEYEEEDKEEDQSEEDVEQSESEESNEDFSADENELKGEEQKLSEETEKFSEGEKELRDEEAQTLTKQKRISKTKPRKINPTKDLEIRNIPKIMNISADYIFRKILQSLNIADQPLYRDEVYFLKYKRSKPYRVLIVPFKFIHIKAEFLKKLPARQIKADKIFKDIQLTEDTKILYFNQPLTPENRYLLWLARQRISELSLKWNVYPKNGKILAKKKSKRKPKEIEITSKEHLLLLK